MAGLATLLDRVERGGRLPADLWWSLVPAPSPDTAAVVAFPGHVVVAADVEPLEPLDRLAPLALRLAGGPGSAGRAG